MQIDLENYQYHEGSELRESVGGATVNALKEQVGGDHYSKLAIQPVEYINANKLTYLQGNVVKYISRYNHKGKPLEDLQKARHYIDMLIELEDKK